MTLSRYSDMLFRVLFLPLADKKDRSMAIELNKQLMLFVDVVHFGSFAEAAKHRDMLPSLLSRNIKTLEEKLGIILLNRTTRSISLTEAGEEIYSQALKIREMENTLNQYAQSYGSRTSGLVRITCASHLSQSYILPVIQTIQSEYPDLFFEVDYDDRRVDIIKEEFDLAIRVWNPQDSALIGQKLRNAKLVMVASPELLQRYGKPEQLSDLTQLPFACYSRLGITRDTLHYYDDQDQLHSLTFKPAYKASSPDSLLQSAKMGMYFTMVTDHNIKQEFDSGELVQLFPELKVPDEDSIYAIYPNRELSFGARLFVEKLKALFKQA